MSDTPRTDAAQEARFEQRGAFPDPVVVECAKLERELNEVKKVLTEVVVELIDTAVL